MKHFCTFDCRIITDIKWHISTVENASYTSTKLCRRSMREYGLAPAILLNPNNKIMPLLERLPILNYEFRKAPPECRIIQIEPSPRANCAMALALRTQWKTKEISRVICNLRNRHGYIYTERYGLMEFLQTDP
jgi:hypothetical protein